MKVIFAAGGTGGHINPALAAAGELRRRHPDAEILFIGTGDHMESRLGKCMKMYQGVTRLSAA